MSIEQPKNPLHGLTLETILTALVDAYGFPVLAEKIALHCFAKDPSVSSSLKFLRKTPWAREKVESLYLWHLREQKRQARRREGLANDALRAKDDAASPDDENVPR
jgi:uncharacterized protein (DUF2132 family)